MGGSLSVASRPGKGTSFTIQLPASKPVIQRTRKIA
jgi:chemotaxis protein histidine kinase CheA